MARANALRGSPATKTRRAYIAGAVNQSDQEPALGALHDSFSAAYNDIGKYTNDFWGVKVAGKFLECSSTADAAGCFIPWCHSETIAAQGGFNSRMTALDALARQYWATAGRRESGLVALLEQADWHEVGLQDYILNANQLWGFVPSAARTWSAQAKQWENSCVASPEPAPESPGTAPQANDPGACPGPLGNLTGSFSHDVGGSDVSLKVGCDSAEVEISRGVGGTLNLFGSGEQDFKKDEFTLIVGVKGGVGHVVEGQSGFYVTSGRQGVTGFGWRVGASGTAVGPSGLHAWGGHENISLVGSIDYIPTALGVGG